MLNLRSCIAKSLIPCLFLGMGCAHAPTPTADSSVTLWKYFTVPDASDPWSAKILGWQLREQAGVGHPEGRSPAEVSGAAVAPPAAVADEAATEAPEPTELRDKYVHFRREQRRHAARSVASWIQAEARNHYIPDGPIDHWATLEETLERNGDDCDGLELLTYHALLDLGFSPTEIYRAIVVRPEDGQHHMVTLWFENPNDPWVIDPTGAMVLGMPRLSEVPGWIPLKVFSETEEFTAQPILAVYPE